MTIHLIASGETGSKWKGIGPSIGVNDSWKWGYPTDYLILLNAPRQFQPSRLETILSSKPRKVYTNNIWQWDKHFNNLYEIAPLIRWTTDKKLSKKTFYHSNTSPFVGLSMAYNWGFNNIVMWGVDLINHQKFGKGTSAHVQEMLKFDSFIKALNKESVNVFIGSKGTSFDNIVPVWIPNYIKA